MYVCYLLHPCTQRSEADFRVSSSVTLSLSTFFWDRVFHRPNLLDWLSGESQGLFQSLNTLPALWLTFYMVAGNGLGGPSAEPWHWPCHAHSWNAASCLRITLRHYFLLKEVRGRPSNGVNCLPISFNSSAWGLGKGSSAGRDGVLMWEDSEFQMAASSHQTE